MGAGRDVFEQAKQAIESWKMFDHAMTTLYWPDTRIERGASVAVQFRAGPFWTLHPCRIVYTIDDPKRFGFAYGRCRDISNAARKRSSSSGSLKTILCRTRSAPFHDPITW
ncbi:MAG: hypothetical protein CMJ64_08305 [Planctomycetaceae bacterium]|nr:hypothetical protein [Planctomycetaceae bacterium]